MNKYGFEKIRVSPLSYDVYRNPFFKRGNKELLNKIEMKRSETRVVAKRRKSSNLEVKKSKLRV